MQLRFCLFNGIFLLDEDDTYPGAVFLALSTLVQNYTERKVLNKIKLKYIFQIKHSTVAKKKKKSSFKSTEKEYSSNYQKIPQLLNQRNYFSSFDLNSSSHNYLITNQGFYENVSSQKSHLDCLHPTDTLFTGMFIATNNFLF